jgi:uncharacterized protein YaeQ
LPIRHLRRNLSFDLVLTHETRSWYEDDERLLLVKRSGESLDHVLMKLLAHLIFYHPELDVEVSVDQHYKPDLVRLDARGEPVQWIECGTTQIDKLDRLTRRNDRCTIEIVKSNPRALRRYRSEAEDRIRYPERVGYTSFREGYLDELATRIERRHELVAVVTPEHEHLYVTVDGEMFETPIVRELGDDETE